MNGPMTRDEERSGFYVRSLYPAEEFSLFLKARAWCLQDAGRYAETLLWSARALQFAPDDPHFAQDAYVAADLAVKHRYRKKYPHRPIPPRERNEEFVFDLHEFLKVEERSLFLTIAAHHAESWGQVDKARTAYEEACRRNFHGNNEQRDLQRFLRKHGSRRRSGSLLPPKNAGQVRRIKLSCRPEDEYLTLHDLVDQFERDGEFLKARDTLHDLYLFDPTDAEVFHRARIIERRPQYQAQLKALKAERQRVAEQRSIQRERKPPAR